jgi:hypothetical protein
VADKKRRDEDEEAAQNEEAEAEEKAEGEGEEASDEENDKPASDEREGDDDGEGEEAAKRVAKALGVDGEAGEAAGEKGSVAQEPEPAPNRAARRRDEALARRKRRKGAEAKTEDDDEALPRDKNARAKELLKRRREQASGARPIQLLPGEMVDDALARTTSAASKWLRKNFSKLQWVILAALVGLGGFLLYSSQSEKKAAAATNDLLQGVSAELGRVIAEDKRSDEEKEIDPAKVYKTIDERNEAALAGYRKAIAEQGDTKLGQLAKLGEAGVLLEKRDYAAAVDAFSAVLASKLAAADIDVKGRATEGLGLAKEGKGDLDGALAAFKELEGVDAKGYKELAMYQQGRILLAKGDKDKAAEILKQVRDKLQTAGADTSAFLYLQSSVDETLRRIDPSLVPAKGTTLGGPKGNNVSPDEMGKIRKILDDAAKKKPQPEEH